MEGDRPGEREGPPSGRARTRQRAPKLDLTLKGQLGEGHFPDSAAPERHTFQDLTGQANVTADLGRGTFGLGAQMGLALAARREDALRFGQLGDSAPYVDLASYGVEGRSRARERSSGAASRSARTATS